MRATEALIPDIIRDSWHSELGDRRQELVFIGIDIDRAAITRQLINKHTGYLFTSD
jgi:G3E family GTPase